MMNLNGTYTPDIMSLELLPSYAGAVQQRIADVSDIIIRLQQDKRRDKAIDMLLMANRQLRVNGLKRYKSSVGTISCARLIDRAEAADREAQKISDSFESIYIGLCKENMLLDTLDKMLGNCMAELDNAADALVEHVNEVGISGENINYVLLANKKLEDLKVSGTIASQGMVIISEISAMNSELSQRINSLKVNTLVLWRNGIAALRNAPDDRANMEKVCGLEDVISAAIANIAR